jgi:C-terminal processing protease CtpA/Prc
VGGSTGASNSTCVSIAGSKARSSSTRRHIALGMKSAAGRAGVEVGDLVLSLDGEPVATVEGLWRALTAARIGRRQPLVVSRRLTKRTLQLTPDERR